MPQVGRGNYCEPVALIQGGHIYLCLQALLLVEQASDTVLAASLAQTVHVQHWSLGVAF